MNQHAIRQSAEALEAVATQLIGRGDSGVDQLYGALQPLLDKAKSGEIIHPLEWNAVPGGWFFTEGELRKYVNLESAYARFKIEVTGGPSPVLEALRKSRDAR